MTSGDDQALYVLPFDHRHSYITGMFHFEPPLTSQQHADVCDSKQLIYEGFQLALEAGVPRDAAGILVDEEFGSAILRDAHQRGFITALSTESSGSEEFRFEYGDDFARHIEVFDPTFAKVLVRYNPEGDHALNLRQEERLKQLSDVCQASGRRFMFELLVPATAQQLAGFKGDRAAYDLTMRPQLMVEAIHALKTQGLSPTCGRSRDLPSATIAFGWSKRRGAVGAARSAALCLAVVRTRSACAVGLRQRQACQGSSASPWVAPAFGMRSPLTASGP
jgi:hypothetical protein